MTIRERLTDFLKKHGIDIEGKLISFSSQRRGGLNVKQKGQINIVFVTPDAVNDLLKGPLGKEIVALSKKQLTGFTRSDLAGYDATTLAAQFDDKELLQSMAKVVSADDLAALSAAITIRRLEDLGQADQALKLRLKLRKRYGVRGNRIFVFYSTGLLREFMGPFLAMVEFTPTITERARAKDVFDRCIEHMDHAVYVNNLYTSDRVVSEVRYRLEVDRAPVVLIFGLGRRVIATIKRGVAELERIEKERQVTVPAIHVKVDEFQTKTIDGVIATVSRT